MLIQIITFSFDWVSLFQLQVSFGLALFTYIPKTIKWQFISDSYFTACQTSLIDRFTTDSIEKFWQNYRMQNILL